jgi:RNA-directed DNA polymerase
MREHSCPRPHQLSALAFFFREEHMVDTIDDKLQEVFQEQRVIQAFYEYKLTKWDRFTDIDEPEINIPMGADGVKFEAFERQLSRNALNVCYRVTHDKYIFYPFRELEIEKEPATAEKPPKYRTLSIASIRDALVQAILYEDVLYEPVESIFKTLDDPMVVSFAYRKGKSAPKAAKAVYDYTQDGYWYVFDADLRKYFDTIPHDRLLDRLAKVIGGTESKTCKLAYRFIHTDRVPYNSYKYAKRLGKRVGHKIFHWTKPKRLSREKGVPQGGVLSGMLANLYLHDFDNWVVRQLAAEIDLKYVRYADDFVILVRTPDALEIVHQKVKEQIELIGLCLNDDKTIKVDIREKGLDFVGFHFDAHHMRVRTRNIDRYKKRINEAIAISPDHVNQRDDPKVTLKWLTRRVNYKVQGHSGEEKCPKCGETRIGPQRSWMAFFQVVTDPEQLRALDKWTRQVIYDYMYKRHHIRIGRKDLRKADFRSLINEKYQIPASHMKPCLCEIDERGIWHFAKDMYQGKTFASLAQKRPFTVVKVDRQGAHILVGGNPYLISQDILSRLWDQLKTNRSIARSELEKQGYQNTSQIVTLLSELPGVNTTLRPIKIYFSGYHPAQFLSPQAVLKP